VVTLERDARAQELQSMIAELLEKTATKLTEIDAVAVLTGPGSFTGTRIGISATNTLGWLLKLPLLPLHDIDFEAAISQISRNQLPTAERVITPTL
jgi:tRNA threonylcarbamoyladenosine biosynthesis protein TsaB